MRRRFSTGGAICSARWGWSFFDTTSIYFEGAGGETIGRHGHSKDHRPDLRQMIVGIAIDVGGARSAANTTARAAPQERAQMWPGNTTDVKSLVPVVERMRAKFRVREVCVVADRGFVSEATLEALGKMDPPVHYVIGVRMRRTKEVGEVVLTSRQPWQEVTPERVRAKDLAPLKVKEVEVEGRRYVLCLNEEEKRKDAHDRAAILESLRRALESGDKSLVGNKGFRRFLKKQEGEATLPLMKSKSPPTSAMTGSSCCAPTPITMRKPWLAFTKRSG